MSHLQYGMFPFCQGSDNSDSAERLRNYSANIKGTESRSGTFGSSRPWPLEINRDVASVRPVLASFQQLSEFVNEQQQQRKRQHERRDTFIDSDKLASRPQKLPRLRQLPNKKSHETHNFFAICPSDIQVRSGQSAAPIGNGQQHNSINPFSASNSVPGSRTQNLACVLGTMSETVSTSVPASVLRGPVANVPASDSPNDSARLSKTPPLSQQSTWNIPLVMRTTGNPRSHQHGVRKGRWTSEEHSNFLKALSLYGRDWSALASIVKTRTRPQIRSHAQKYFGGLKRSNQGAAFVENSTQQGAEAFLTSVYATKRQIKVPAIPCSTSHLGTTILHQEPRQQQQPQLMLLQPQLNLQPQSQARLMMINQRETSKTITTAAGLVDMFSS